MKTREQVIEFFGERRKAIEKTIGDFVENNKMQFFTPATAAQAMDGLFKDQVHVEILEAASRFLIADAEIIESVRRVLATWYDQQQTYLMPNSDAPGATERGTVIATCIDQLTSAISEAGHVIDLHDSEEAYFGWMEAPDGDGDYVRTTGPGEADPYRLETVSGGQVITSGVNMPPGSFHDEVRWLKLPPHHQRANRYPMPPLNDSQAARDLERERRKIMRIDSEVAGWKASVLGSHDTERLLDRILEITRSHGE